MFYKMKIKMFDKENFWTVTQWRKLKQEGNSYWVYY